MIRINLVPGAKKRRRASIFSSLSLPSFGGFSGPDPWVTGAVAAWILAPALIGWLVLDVRERRQDVTLEIEQAQQDSARYARIIETVETLEARRDTIAEKLDIIETIDAGRFTWPHILDEISRALPDYTWLTALSQLEGGANPRFRIEGYTGNNFALTRFMAQLELSPFIRDVRFASTQRSVVQDEMVYAFVLDARYETPTPDMIETVPLLTDEPEG